MCDDWSLKLIFGAKDFRRLLLCYRGFNIEGYLGPCQFWVFRTLGSFFPKIV